MKDFDKLTAELAASKAWWLKVIEQQGVDQKVQTPLYHYTDAAALQGIVEKGEFWFTSMFHLNDPTELKYGWDIAQEVLQEQFGADNDRLKRVHEFFKGGFSGMLNEFGYFVASFSRNGDDLGQWRAYGDNACGVSIGFAPSLFHAVPPTEGREPNELAYVAEVIYDRDKARVLLSAAVERMMSTVKMGLAHQYDDEAQGIGFFVDCMTALSSPILWYSLQIKHHAYEQEAETRLMIQAPKPLLRKHIRFRPRRSSLVPFVTSPFPTKTPGAITEIIIGPDADPRLRSAVNELLFVNELDTEVRPSSIPYAL